MCTAMGVELPPDCKKESWNTLIKVSLIESLPRAFIGPNASTLSLLLLCIVAYCFLRGRVLLGPVSLQILSRSRLLRASWKWSSSEETLRYNEQRSSNFNDVPQDQVFPLNESVRSCIVLFWRKIVVLSSSTSRQETSYRRPKPSLIILIMLLPNVIVGNTNTGRSRNLSYNLCGTNHAK